MMLLLPIPMPIRTNKAYRIGNRGGRATQWLIDEAKTYKAEVTLLVRNAVLAQGFVFADADFFGLELVFAPPNRRGDVDGGLKLTQDAVADGLGINDRRFSEVCIQRLAPCKIPTARIKIYLTKEWSIQNDNNITKRP